MARSREKIICSACLLGVKCRYDGKSKLNKKVLGLAKRKILIPVCPEQLGGLPTPREPSRLTGNAIEVLKRKAKVLTRNGKDVTKEFIRGAKESLKIAKILGVREAVLKQTSPSCGCGKTIFYNPRLPEARETVKGDGITASLLKKNKIKVISEEELNKI